MKIIAAPIRLDAMVLLHDTVVKDALADYSLLPYTDKTRDYNPDTPYVGESIINHPFQDKNLLLRAGVHLHWALPYGLSKTLGVPFIRKDGLNGLLPFFPENMTLPWEQVKDQIWDSMLMASKWIKPIDTGRASILPLKNVDQNAFDQGVNLLSTQVGWSTDGAETFVDELMKVMNRPLGADYPAVPDVWLVNRKKSSGTITKSWLVESHFIAATQSAENGNLGAVNVPYHDDRHNNKTQPFRFIGRQSDDQEGWRSGKRKGTNYLQELTAVGYNPQAGSKGFAEPTFAAFYPNCMSVFGLYDAEITAPDADIIYEVLGLYANPENDYLKIFVKDFANRYEKDENFFKNLNAAIESEFLWKTETDFPINSDETTPEQLVLFGKAIPKLSDAPAAHQIEIAIGNTGTEALSGYLGTKVDGDKIKIEEILESIQLSSRLQNKVLDIDHKFQEGRHDKGFTALPGGALWSIKLENEKEQSAAGSNEGDLQEPALPDRLAVLLNETNTLQFKYDKEWREVPYLRRQLFSDWYKYMVSAYPPVDNKTTFFDNDELLDYIRKEGIPNLEEKLNALGTLSIAKDEKGRFKDVRVTGDEISIASELAAKLLQLAHAIHDSNHLKNADGLSWKDKGKCLALRQVAAPRFWQASDPVVLFAETFDENQATSLHNDRYPTPGSSDPIACKVLDNIFGNPADFTWEEANKFFVLTSALFKNIKETGPTEEDVIWRPFMMEWMVEFMPAFPGSNEATENRLYDPDYINQHYQLKETDPDVSLKTDEDIFSNANIYSGNTILTPTAGISLDNAIRQFADHYGASQTDETLQMLEKVRQYLEKTQVLSQSLGGFHEALLTQKQTRQLDIADPLGFPEYQEFAEKKVAPLVEKSNLTAPQPFGDFNPIRAGLVKILNLRLIDTFGQTLGFENPPIITSETVGNAVTSSKFNLKPRLSQPARLNFRFLSAAAGEQEMNAHPASSPVCGWILPNNLDRSIMFYDQEGSALGALTMDATHPWSPAPDAVSSTYIGSIGDLHLQRVARYLFDRQLESIETSGPSENSFLHHFINALDSALENIDPENFAEHQELAVLMGNPIAVVRAKLSIELAGPPAHDQSWTQLAHELQGHGRSSDGFTKVKFPIRLGEYKQLNDGLVGYWVEEADGQLGADYFSSEAGENQGPHIKTYVPGGQSLNTFHAIADEPFCVTMLVDPKGSIHAISGILPVKSISIPKDQYKNALKKIGITFLTAPLLSTENHLKLSLPKEPGAAWTWLEKSKDKQWSEVPQTVIIDKSIFDTKFPDQPALWMQLVEKGWLKPQDDNPEKALVTTAVHHAFPPNEEGGGAPFPTDIGKRLDNFFDTYGKRIEPFDGHASFQGAQVVREGWLRLDKLVINEPSTVDTKPT